MNRELTSSEDKENTLSNLSERYEHLKSLVTERRSEFDRLCKFAEKETEYRELSIHALRYTYITRTRRLIDSSTTMLMSGHTDLKMTYYYTRFELEETIN